MAELLGIILIALTGGATLAALLTTLAILASGLTNQTAEVLGNMPGRSLILGLVNLLFAAVVAALLAQIGERLPGALGGLFGLLALFVLLLIIALVALGLSGLVWLLARRMGATGSPAVGQLLRAGMLLVAAGLAPIAGWFFLAPLAILTGLGAALIALARRLSGLVSRAD